MTRAPAVAATLGLMALVALAGCSSDGSAASSPTPSAPSTSAASSSAVPASASAPSTTAPAEIPGEAEAVAFVEGHRIEIDLMINTAVRVRQAVNRGNASSGPCGELVDATFRLDDVFPKFGTAANEHPLIQALLNATSTFTQVGYGCNLSPAQLRKMLTTGFKNVTRAEKLAKQAGTHL